jgi:hypothetical protein
VAPLTPLCGTLECFETPVGNHWFREILMFSNVFVDTTELFQRYHLTNKILLDQEQQTVVYQLDTEIMTSLEANYFTVTLEESL